MTDAVLPSLFVSHGPPTMVLDDLPEAKVMAAIARDLPRPKAILCVSAHWIEDKPTLSTAEAPETIHDFYGFPRELYALHYPAPGAPDVARRAADRLQDAGIDCALDSGRGLDHGAWEPLMLMFPDAAIPVAQLSLSAQADGAAHLAIGRALAPLRAEGVLIMGSGTATHNLREWRAGGATPDWARAFEDWLVGAVAGGDAEAVAHYQDKAPHAARAHPSAEHFLPLPVAMGAGSQPSGEPGVSGRVLHRGFSYGSLSMAIFAFGGAA